MRVGLVSGVRDIWAVENLSSTVGVDCCDIDIFC